VSSDFVIVFSYRVAGSIGKYNKTWLALGAIFLYYLHMDTKTLFKPWQDALALWPELRKAKAPSFKVSNRLTRCAGLCYVETGEITLSGLYLAKYPHIMLGEILAHETAHYIDYALNGWRKYKRHHGREWCDIMYALDYFPNPYHSMEL
jgi:hypothetical protein